MDTEQLDTKIDELREKLQHLEDTDPLYLQEELQYLRHNVLFVHARLEISLDLLIGRGITRYISHKMTTLERQGTFRQMQKVLKELGFMRKLSVAKKLYQFRDYPKLPHLLEEVNRIRNQFSHLASNQDDVREFTNKKKQVEVLECLLQAMGEMNNLFANFEVEKVS